MACLATVLAAFSLPVPAVVAPPATSAQTPAERSALPATAGWLSVRGPERLAVDRELRFGVRCRFTCEARVLAIILWPDRDNLAAAMRGVVRGGETRVGVIRLNQAGLRTLADRAERSALVVTVRARERLTGSSRAARRVFRFRGGTAEAERYWDGSSTMRGGP